MNIKQAREIKVGDQIGERDGFLWTVTEIKNKNSRLVFTLKSDFSNFPEHRTAGKGIEKTFSGNKKLSII